VGNLQKIIVLVVFITTFFHTSFIFAAFPDIKVTVLRNSGENFISTSYKVKGSDILAAKVEALMNAPASDIINLLRDFENYRNTIPFFNNSKILSKIDNVFLLKLGATILNGALTINAVVSVKESSIGFGGTKFKLKLKKGDLDKMDAIWYVYPLDEKNSVLVFKLMVDPGVWFVRDVTLSKYNQVNARRIIRSIRRQL